MEIGQNYTCRKWSLICCNYEVYVGLQILYCKVPEIFIPWPLWICNGPNGFVLALTALQFRVFLLLYSLLFTLY